MLLIKEQSSCDRNLYFFRSYEDQYAASIDGYWKPVKYNSGLQLSFSDIGISRIAADVIQEILG